MKLIMNENGVLSHGSGSVIDGGTFTIITPPVFKVKTSGVKIYAGDLRFTFAGGNAPGFDSNSIATLTPQIIQPTAQKTMASGKLVVRAGDYCTMTATGTVSGTPATITGIVVVKEAGQEKAMAK